jgi:hypothetical protein
LRASEANLTDYIRSRSNTKPHLLYAQGEEQPTAQSGADALIFIPDTPGV